MVLLKTFEASEASSRRGFTLVEVLLVLSLLAMISGIALSGGSNDLRGEAFRSERTLLLTALQKARAASLNNLNLKPHGVAIFPSGHPDAYVIFEGESYAGSDHAFDEVLPSRYPVSFSEASPKEIVFEQLSGGALCDGEVCEDGAPLSMLDTLRGISSDIVINAEGRIE